MVTTSAGLIIAPVVLVVTFAGLIIASVRLSVGVGNYCVLLIGILVPFGPVFTFVMSPFETEMKYDMWYVFSFDHFLAVILVLMLVRRGRSMPLVHMLGILTLVVPLPVFHEVAPSSWSSKRWFLVLKRLKNVSTGGLTLILPFSLNILLGHLLLFYSDYLSVF